MLRSPVCYFRLNAFLAPVVFCTKYPEIRDLSFHLTEGKPWFRGVKCLAKGHTLLSSELASKLPDPELRTGSAVTGNGDLVSYFHISKNHHHICKLHFVDKKHWNAPGVGCCGGSRAGDRT